MATGGIPIRFRDCFDDGALRRGADYAARGLVKSVQETGKGTLQSTVSNGRGGHNCKHVVAALSVWHQTQAGRKAQPRLPGAVQGWLAQVKESTRAAPESPEDTRPEDYPDRIKDRLLYVLKPDGPELVVETFKGRINAAGTGLNKAIRRYDPHQSLRSNSPAQFIRPLDIDLLPALAQAQLWQIPYGYGYGLADLLRPTGETVLALIRRLCETGRFLHDATPDARLEWSEHRPLPRLGWRTDLQGYQKLGFEDATGGSLDLRAVPGAGLWIDPEQAMIGSLATPVPLDLLRLVASSPQVGPEALATLSSALPETLGGLALPRPKAMTQTRRAAITRFARLILGAETARDGSRYFGSSVTLPALTLRFVYDGQEADEDGQDIRHLEADRIVTISRDPDWEAACRQRLAAAGALMPEELELLWPGDRMMACDFVFADDEFNGETLEMTSLEDALTFAFRAVPELRRDGWEVIETGKWPYRISDAPIDLTVATRAADGAAFKGNDWFSLGFQAEIGGKQVDLAPLVAGLLEQMHRDWDDVPDLESLTDYLAQYPVFLAHGKAYAALDLSPMAGLLHLFCPSSEFFGELMLFGNGGSGSVSV